MPFPTPTQLSPLAPEVGDFPVPLNQRQGAGAPVAAGPVSQPQEPGFFEQLKSTPEGKAALLQMIGGLLKPVNHTNTAASVFGDALANSAQGFIANRDTRLKTEDVQNKTSEAERQDRETNPTEASKISLDEALIEYYGKMPVGGAGTGKAEPWNDDGFVKNWAKINGISEGQAAVAIYREKISGGKSNPEQAKLAFAANAGENLVYEENNLRTGMDIIGDAGKQGNLDSLQAATPAHFDYLLSNPQALLNAYTTHGNALVMRASVLGKGDVLMQQIQKLKEQQTTGE